MTDDSSIVEELPKVPYPGQLVIPPMAPLVDVADLGKGIIVPAEHFDSTLQEIDWSWHQISRDEYPRELNIQGKDARERLMFFQLAIICADPLLWCTAFLREPEDPDHQDPYQFFDYQIPSLRDPGSVVHQDGAEVGKTREIVAWTLWKNLTVKGGSGLIVAPLQIHLDEIIYAKLKQLDYNPALSKSLKKPYKKQPYVKFEFDNEFLEDYRPAGFDGTALRGVHAKTFGAVDEAAKMKNTKQWSEFWGRLKPSAVARIYTVPDGDRETEYYKLTMAAERTWPPSDKELKTEEKDRPKLESAKEMPANMTFTRYRWSKRMMPFPYWSPERKQFFIKRWGGEDNAEFKHNVDGDHGDPVNPVFPWQQLKHCIKDIPEYRCLKVLVDSGKGNVLVEGYRCEFELGNDGPTPRHKPLVDDIYDAETFFAFDENGDNEFKRLVKGFFNSVPGQKVGGGDFGYSPDPTEITIWNIIGKKDRLVARLQLKQVTYDQQCQALDAMDDIYGPLTSLSWGTDFGNAGSAVAHDLQGLQIYERKDYDSRLTGFSFQSNNEHIDEEGNEIRDGKSEKAAKVNLKELATEWMIKRVQRQEVEYPADEDLITAYTNHTARNGERQKIYSKDNDHLIDSNRVAKLQAVLAEFGEDLFSC